LTLDTKTKLKNEIQKEKKGKDNDSVAHSFRNILKNSTRMLLSYR